MHVWITVIKYFGLCKYPMFIFGKIWRSIFLFPRHRQCLKKSVFLLKFGCSFQALQLLQQINNCNNIVKSGVQHKQPINHTTNKEDNLYGLWYKKKTLMYGSQFKNFYKKTSKKLTTTCGIQYDWNHLPHACRKLQTASKNSYHK